MSKKHMCIWQCNRLTRFKLWESLYTLQSGLDHKQGILETRPPCWCWKIDPCQQAPLSAGCKFLLPWSCGFIHWTLAPTLEMLGPSHFSVSICQETWNFLASTKDFPHPHKVLASTDKEIQRWLSDMVLLLLHVAMEAHCKGPDLRLVHPCIPHCRWKNMINTSISRQENHRTPCRPNSTAIICVFG